MNDAALGTHSLNRKVERVTREAMNMNDGYSFAVMDEERGRTGFHIVRVVGVDGEVADTLVLGPGLGCGELDVGASAGAEPHAGLEFACVDPFAGCGDPEGVVVGRDQCAGFAAVVAVGVDGELDKVLGSAAGNGAEHRLWGGLPGARVGGEYHVADLDFVDRFS
jgi:hypothetical protein